MNDDEEAKFAGGCLNLASSMQVALVETERMMTERLIEGKLVRQVGDLEVTPKMYTNGALLLILLGILADPGPDSDALVAAAKIMGNVQIDPTLPKRQHIREIMDAIFESMGLTGHRPWWN